MAKTSYLSRLPRSAQRRGDHTKGQIEIVTKKKAVKKIADECSEELSGSALGKGSKQTGILLEDKVHMVVRDAVIYPSGATGCPMRVIGKTQYDGVNGVVALPWLNGQLVLRRIYRHPMRAWELEAVRGRREQGMTSRTAMRKEIKEELGYTARRLIKIGTLAPESALMSSVLDVYWAELVEGPRKDDPEDKEALGEVLRLDVGEIAEKISTGEIRDGYTIAAFTMAQINGLMEAFPPVKQPEEAAT